VPQSIDSVQHRTGVGFPSCKRIRVGAPPCTDKWMKKHN
jgi:hypothetical protein